MTLVLLIAIPLIGGLIAAYAGKSGREAPRWIALAALASVLALAVSILLRGPQASSAWYAEVRTDWIPELGIGFHLAADGVSLSLVVLTAFLGIMATLSYWKEIEERIGFFHFNVLWCLAGIIGVFVSLDLFVFYFFWEVMLVPMYFLIAIWGHERRMYAAVKFFIFTQLSGLLMLVAILGLYFIHESRMGFYSFDYMDLLGLTLEPRTAAWLMAGFLAAFLVKLPALFLHTWLPDAHTEAPTAGSVILAGLLLKTGAYGLLRFAVPLFPEAVPYLAPVMMSLGVAGILYGAVLAFAQTDLKRLVAYTSVSHMGFVLLGVFAWNEIALQGVMVQMICHGLSTGALFIMVGALQERLKTRDMERMGGFWRESPRMGGLMMVFALASLGLPGLGNFVGEFLVLLGTYRVSPAFASLAALGFVVSAIYSLWMIQRVFFGPAGRVKGVADLSARETLVAALMAAALVVIGFYPQPVLDAAKPGLNAIMSAEGTQAGALPAETGKSGGAHAGR
ncbi:MAG: NADH-quinone oxidoreductase subunit M [Nitrospirota bacterium]